MGKDVEHFFMYAVAICTSFENGLFNSFPHVNWIICSFDVHFFSTSLILDINLLSNEEFAKVFSNYVGCHFILVFTSFSAQLFNLMHSFLSILS
jgi:hypothetical protein